MQILKSKILKQDLITAIISTVFLLPLLLDNSPISQSNTKIFLLTQSLLITIGANKIIPSIINLSNVNDSKILKNLENRITLIINLVWFTLILSDASFPLLQPLLQPHITNYYNSPFNYSLIFLIPSGQNLPILLSLVISKPLYYFFGKLILFLISFIILYILSLLLIAVLKKHKIISNYKKIFSI